MNILAPKEIEAKSFQIIGEELSRLRQDGQELPQWSDLEEAVVKRVIHTSADFDYAKNLIFTHDAAALGQSLLFGGADVVTDTKMAAAGISKPAMAKAGGTVSCYIGDDDVAEAAAQGGGTRAAAAVDKAAALLDAPIFAIGNAPTALMRIHELAQQGKCRPALIVAVPVGFVNVVESKELIRDMDVPAIIALGRKGGSNVAAAIINALLYWGQR